MTYEQTPLSKNLQNIDIEVKLESLVQVSVTEV